MVVGSSIAPVAGHITAAVTIGAVPEPSVSLDAADMRNVVAAFSNALIAHRGAINRLNVYPVPDGDTGTNMSLTMASVTATLEAANPADMAEFCEALAHGSLMGARGNSGVILSQILRGWCDVARHHDVITAEVMVDALQSASVAAYGAVMRPVEGTILTVVRALADSAAATATDGASLLMVAEASLAGGVDALARTPDLLPILKDAGVVDAGGTGLLLLCHALLQVIDGRAMPDAPETTDGELPPVLSGPAPDVASLRYEVMYFLHTGDDRVDEFKKAWMNLGDSIVVVGGDGLYNCHIHTNDIGGAIEAGIEAGKPAKIRVTDLFEEVEEQAWVREASGSAPAATAPLATTGVVSVGVGEGIAALFRSLGVHEIVTGGQSMNPSTADLLAAVEACPAQGVVILPNNKNIVPVAQQVGDLTSKSVAVVTTHNVAEALAALVAYDPEADVVENHRSMGAAAESVIAGEVTRAVRDSNSPVGPVRQGDFIGISRVGIVSIADSVLGAATALLATLVDGDHEIVTVITGADASPNDTAKIEAWLEIEHPEVEVEVHHGGQPLYPFEFGVE